MYYHSLYYEDAKEAKTIFQWIKQNVQTVDLKVLRPDDAGLTEIQFTTEHILAERIATHLTENKSPGQYALDIES